MTEFRIMYRLVPKVDWDKADRKTKDRCLFTSLVDSNTKNRMIVNDQFDWEEVLQELD